jgi:hypothetical protein
MLTLAADAELEPGRARDAREPESLHLASGHVRWLRDQGVKAHACFSLAGEELLQLAQFEMTRRMTRMILKRDEWI